MNLRSLWIFCFLCTTLSLLYAQTDVDAFRLSQYGTFGTARAQAIGGAITAVGADITSATTNPAGLGLMRTSTFQFSPSISLYNTTGRFIDRENTQSDFSASIPSMGVAFTSVNYQGEDGSKRDGAVSFTFAMGYNQLENFERNTIVQDAFNEFSSITNFFTELAGDTPPSLLGQNSFAALAYDAFLIDSIWDGSQVGYFGAAERGQIDQTIQVQEFGRRTGWYFSLGNNLNDKIIWGATLNLESVRYTRSFSFTEEDTRELYEFYEPRPNTGFPLELPLVDLRFFDRFTTRGTGYGGTFGMIIRPINPLRIGISARTPTFYQLRDVFDTEMSSTHIFRDSVGPEIATATTSQDFIARYQLLSPFRANVGIMYQIQKYGFLSADVEYVNYNQMRLSSQVTDVTSPDFYSFEVENQTIEENYLPVFNLRVGGEARWEMLRFRAGYAYLPGPTTAESKQYVDDVDRVSIRNIDDSRQILSFGVGYRQPNFAFDVSLINQQQQSKEKPYTLSEPEAFQPTLIRNNRSTRLTATLGFYW